VPGPEFFLKLFETPEAARLRDTCMQLDPEAFSDESLGMTDVALC